MPKNYYSLNGLTITIKKVSEKKTLEDTFWSEWVRTSRRLPIFIFPEIRLCLHTSPTLPTAPPTARIALGCRRIEFQITTFSIYHHLGPLRG